MTAVLLVACLMLGWTWLLYPLAMRAVAAVRPAPVRDDPAVWPSVSVVLASRATAPEIVARVDDVRRSHYPGPLDVYVALDHAIAGSLDAVRRAVGPAATVLCGDAPGGKATALNAGVRASTAEILVFTDTHQRFARDAVRTLVASCVGGPYVAVSGMLDLPPATARSPIGRYWRIERQLRADEARMHSAVGVSGSIWALRREMWQPLPPDCILDDLHTPMRVVLAGGRVGFEPGAVAHDVREATANVEFQRKVRTLTGNFQLMAYLPGVLVPFRNPIWAQFVSHKVLRLLTPWLLMAAGLSGGWILLARFPRSALGLALAAAAVAGALVVLGFGRRMLAVLRWLGLMQLAILAASWNGITNRWDVWSAPHRGP